MDKFERKPGRPRLAEDEKLTTIQVGLAESDLARLDWQATQIGGGRGVAMRYLIRQHTPELDALAPDPVGG